MFSRLMMTIPLSNMKWLCIESINDDFRVGKSYSFVNGMLKGDNANYTNHPKNMVSAKFVPMLEWCLIQAELL